MPLTTVVFVHGFLSGPEVWNSFFARLEADDELFRAGFDFARFQYETKLLEWNLTKRIPNISDCASALGGFLDREYGGNRRLILVGHSMGGLVIQAFLAQRLDKRAGRALARIRAVILFATPNRGSTILHGLRSLISKLDINPQDAELRVLNTEVDRVSEVIERRVLGATGVADDACPIPFQAFWGASDNVVLPPSARGPFLEASALPGGHSEIIQCDPTPKDDPRYTALRMALLHPMGHPAIYEIDAFRMNLAIEPNAVEDEIWLRGLDKPTPIHPDNVATRVVEIAFAAENRCVLPYEQMYRSYDGYVEAFGMSPPNEALKETLSDYSATGRKFSYVFTPRAGETSTQTLRIYNGYGEGERKWHNHMKTNARYRVFRFTLDLRAYARAGYEISIEPAFYFHTGTAMDHELCAGRTPGTLKKPCAPSEPWVWTWELTDITGGIVDLIWDVKKRSGV